MGYNSAKKCFVKLFRGNILVGSQKNIEVPILTLHNPKETIPSVCITKLPSIGILDEKIINIKTPLDEDHPYYDDENPDELYCQTVRYIRRYDVALAINIYAYNDSDREEIYNQLVKILFEAKNCYYQYCAYYLEGDCSIIDDECKAKSIVNKYSIQNRCPYPDTYNPQNIFEEYGVDKETIFPREPIPLDELGDTPEIYRSQWELSLHTIDIRDIPTLPVCEADIIEEQWE